MIGIAADENLDNDIVRALRRRLPDVDVMRAQDVGLSGRDDPTILDWAASSDGVLLTHDVATMIRHALDRVRAGLPMSGLIVIPQRVAIVTAVDDLLLLVTRSSPDELAGQILYVPLR
ncbi:MAG TPA: DUF5615 family PIN-like protein [Polyangiaceae bacterium]|jgi:hypothetical protein|nr:DUF5615 family PIN-like protein [Polyangiaceae bacterium]